MLDLCNDVLQLLVSRASIKSSLVLYITKYCCFLDLDRLETLLIEVNTAAALLPD